MYCDDKEMRNQMFNDKTTLKFKIRDAFSMFMLHKYMIIRAALFLLLLIGLPTVQSGKILLCLMALWMTSMNS